LFQHSPSLSTHQAYVSDSIGNNMCSKVIEVGLSQRNNRYGASKFMRLQSSTEQLLRYRTMRWLQRNNLCSSYIELQAKHFSAFVEFYLPQVLSEHISGIVHARDKLQHDLIFDYLFTNVMVANIDVFGSTLSDWVLSDKDRSLVVTADRGGMRMETELPQKLTYPDDLSGTI